MVELLYRPEGHTTAFAIWHGDGWTIESKADIGEERLVPFSPDNNLIKNGAVLLPSEPCEYGSEQELVAEIQDFIHRYADLSPVFERLATHYVVLTWLYDAFNEVPYLRLRGDYGTGKTRTLLTLGSLCNKPFFASGASTVSPLFHTLNAFQGTLIFDEADFRFSDEKAEVVKILNNGNVKGLPVLRTMLNRQKEFNPQAFQVFGPKIVATRSSYEDRGLESRFLSEEMGARPLRQDIPINLPPSFADAARALRNKLLLFRFHRRMTTSLNARLLEPGLEPRLNQILLPLLSIVSDTSLHKDFRSLAADTQSLLAAERGNSIEGHIVVALLGLMANSDRAAIGVGEIAAAVADRYGSEYERPVTSRWVGGILRRRLNIQAYKSHGVYVVPMSERVKVALLAQRFGISPDEIEDADVELGDVGTSETS